MIPYALQDIKQEDIDAVVQVLRSDWISQGPVLPRFEQAVADYCGAKYAVGVNSATSALHLACRALDLGPDDWLWTSPITFVASANCAMYCGAKVDFVDIDPDTYNLSVKALASKLDQAEKNGQLPKIVIPVHFAGQPCDMPAIHALGQRYGFRIIEDASHAIGASYLNAPFSSLRRDIDERTIDEIGNSRLNAVHSGDPNRIKIGACAHSDITVFSFHPAKIITTGEGGIALTNSAALQQKIALLRGHGITRDPLSMTHESEGPWYYQQIDLGYNYRISELHAALGLSQMQRLDIYVARRNELATRYNQLLENLPVTVPWQAPGTNSAMHLYVIRLQRDKVTKSHRKVFESLREQGVGVNLHYIPVHTQPYYRQMGFREGDYPQAELYYNEAISLPIYPRLSLVDQDKVVWALSQTLISN